MSSRQGRPMASPESLASANSVQRRVPDEPVRRRYRGCLLGGAVGDALGAPVEFLRYEEILRRFGSLGITAMSQAYGRTGAVTDDTQMMLFTAEGMLRSHVRSSDRGICHPPTVIAHAYLRWLHTQGDALGENAFVLDGWLIRQRELFARRAPGVTCMSALRAMSRPGQPARNDSKGCGGVMRVAPVGMMLQSLARLRPERRDECFRDAFTLASDAAALTHGHPTGQLASGMFSGVVFQLLQGRTLPESIDATLPMLEAHDHHEETSQAVRNALRLAVDRPRSLAAIRELGEGWVAEEALAIGLYSALCSADFESGVVLAVNHDGDSDSTGLIAGHLLGAIHGVEAIPKRWLEPLELRKVIEDVADDLATVGNWEIGYVTHPKSISEAAYYEGRYPGH